MMKRARFWVSSTTLIGAVFVQGFLVPSADAVRGRGPVFSNRLVLASGEHERIARATERAVPDDDRVMAAWSHFVAANGSGWRVMWDRASGVPLRVYGRGIDAPNTTASPAAAEDFARRMLRAHLDLWGRGTKAEHFTLVSNHLSDDGVRSVGFRQSLDGLLVVGGQVSFRFKKDRLIVVASEIVTGLSDLLSPSMNGSRIGDAEARVEATRFVERDLGAKVEATKVGGSKIVAVIDDEGRRHAARVVEVIVSSQRPVGRWAVYVDAETGAPFARKQLLRFFGGTLALDVPERRPTAQRIEAPAVEMNITVNGAAAATSNLGTFSTATSAPSVITASPIGRLVKVVNDAGARATATFTVADQGRAVWSLKNDELGDAQLTAYAASHRAKAWVRVQYPALRYLDEQLEANVNLADTCNAFSDGVTINFFQASRSCENTARLPDVVMHEFGHSVHAHAIIDGVGAFDDALGEGVSDYMAATIVGDPGMGRGFFFTNDPLRHLDPSGSEARWPTDVAQDPHDTGLIIAGTLWDLRKVMGNKLGQAAGIAYVDRLWYKLLERSSDIPTTYVEALAADDDDGNLENGTPNLCDISAAFAAHGLADIADIGPALGPVQFDRMVVSFSIGERVLCPGAEFDRATVTWGARGVADFGGVIPMQREGNRLVATIPEVPRGNILRYGVDVRFNNQMSLHFPDNRADPQYEVYLGDVTPLFCTDFEADAIAEGWSHRLVAGRAREGADDWAWGPPRGTPQNGDPTTAASGTGVIGNDLGGGDFDGMYQRGVTNEITSPPIDVAGYSTVRLQYKRWLNVEDGFFDQAEIRVGGEVLWRNLATNENGSTHHTDREWRFHDVDLSPAVTSSATSISVSFRIKSDRSLQLGGWTIDDFCVVVPKCGDRIVDPGEECDDGNMLGGDGCQPGCTRTEPGVCGNGTHEFDEGCDDGNQTSGDGCEANCVVTPPVRCGDGIVQAGEACDEGSANGSGACSATCEVLTPQSLDERQPGGCGCNVARTTDARGGLVLMAFIALLLASRRRPS